MVAATRATGGYRLVALFFGLKLLLQLAVAHRYNYHTDELYFIACGKHLAWGYVDQTPFVPWLARLVGELSNYSLVALRTPSALAGALTVALTLMIVREWNGARLAQIFAGVAMLIAPAYLQMASLIHIPVFEGLFWTTAAYLVVLIVERDRPRLWLAVGAVAGIGLMNKPTMGLWGLGLACGLLLGPHRQQLRSRWLWAGVAVAALILLPNVIWQARHEWATVQFFLNLEQGVLATVPRHLFLLGQVLYLHKTGGRARLSMLYLHPLGFPLALAGLYYLFTAQGERFRIFAWIYVVCLVVFTLGHGKPYYLAPAYPPLFAAGGLWLEQRLRDRPVRASAVVSLQLVLGAFTALFALPLASLETADAVISRLLGWVVPDPTMLTGDFHREYGWREQAAAVAQAVEALPAADRKRVVILAGNYSEAAAIDFYGGEWALPPAFSGHMNYFLWGPPEQRDATIVSIGISPEVLASICTEPRQVARTHHPLAVASENNLPVWVCRHTGVLSGEAWSRLKRFGH